MVITAIQSDKFTNKVAKLSYQVWSPFLIVECVGRESNLVRKLNKLVSSEPNFMVIDLYLIHFSLNPCEPVNSSNVRYLIRSYSPIINLLIKSLNIELYNKKWFDKQLGHLNLCLIVIILLLRFWNLTNTFYFLI